MTTPSRTVRSERRGAVEVVRIDRPERRNAVDRATAEALDDAIARADDDPRVGAIVLIGADGTFCAGADLHAIAQGAPNRLEEDLGGPMGPSRRTTATPTIAAVEGHAVAGGLELALWCDLRVVADDAVLGVFCRRWGVPLVDGGTVRLPRVVGLGVALDLVLTGREVHADEALRIGLATRVVPSGTTLEAAVALGEQLAAFPRACLVADLRSTREAFDRPLDEALLAEHRRGVASMAASEGDGGMRDGVARFAAGAGRHGEGVRRPADGDGA